MSEILKAAMEQLEDDVIEIAVDLMEGRMRRTRQMAKRAGRGARGGPFNDDGACARMLRLVRGEQVTDTELKQVETDYAKMYLNMAVAEIEKRIDEG